MRKRMRLKTPRMKAKRASKKRPEGFFFSRRTKKPGSRRAFSCSDHRPCDVVGMTLDQRAPQFLDGAVLDLAHALFGNAEPVAERFERRALFRQAAFAHDAQFTL